MDKAVSRALQAISPLENSAREPLKPLRDANADQRLRMIQRLFLRMSTLYGSKFADMWRGIDEDEIKRCWSDELAIFTIQEITEGVNSLNRSAWPPTLPEFMAMCSASKKTPSAQIPYVSTFGKYDPNEPETKSAREQCFETARRLGFQIKSLIGAERA